MKTQPNDKLRGYFIKETKLDTEKKDAAWSHLYVKSKYWVWRSRMGPEQWETVEKTQNVSYMSAMLSSMVTTANNVLHVWKLWRE